MPAKNRLNPSETALRKRDITHCCSNGAVTLLVDLCQRDDCSNPDCAYEVSEIDNDPVLQ